ncbi:aldo/keto reductase [Sphingobacterium griseoflavum]|uniref:Oxidoreductase YqkF n=1 Tax=Sphingobacterium griseoflavum TaxID=1474952 RepID=A0ABQ3HTP1_9SPHI|nr:aldo/keto reductase [Sphingobacterium griseoflavum]GHE33760.1 putative oxidoreductase YqkF [Sphingobacterium griseoflavum]
MQLTRLGSSSLMVSPVGLGGMSLKGGTTKHNTEILLQAVDAGINYFDTADLYERGMNEELIGQALRSVRDQVVIATKVGNQWRSDGSTWDWKASKPYIIKAVEASLSRLRTDRIDLYQLHGGTIDDPIEEIIEAFEELVNAGKIRYYGLSSIRPNVIGAYAEKSNIVSVMMQYSLLDRRPEDVFSMLQKNGIGLISRGALTQGLLIDKPLEQYLQLTSSEVGHAKRSVERLAQKLGVSTLQVLLSYVLSQDVVDVAVVGVRTLAQIRDLQAASQKLMPFSSAALADLTSGLRRLAYMEHR